MALVGMSEDLYVNAFVTCVICEQRVFSAHVTAGAAYTNEQHAFACNQHLTQRGTWITAWARLSTQAQAGNTQQSGRSTC